MGEPHTFVPREFMGEFHSLTIKGSSAPDLHASGCPSLVSLLNKLLESADKHGVTGEMKAGVL